MEVDGCFTVLACAPLSDEVFELGHGDLLLLLLSILLVQKVYMRLLEHFERAEHLSSGQAPVRVLVLFHSLRSRLSGGVLAIRSLDCGIGLVKALPVHHSPILFLCGLV